MGATLSRDLFDFSDYKGYLRFRFAEAKESALSRSKFAEAVGCHPGYISQVLNGKAHLSLEQAERANRYLGHVSQESDFFMTLVLLGRAGTPELKSYFSRQRDGFLELRRSLQNRLGISGEISDDARALYYSSWIYGAVHVALSIPQLRSPEQLSRYFAVPEARIREVLRFLVSCGIAAQKDRNYVSKIKAVHLARSSPHITRHHANWRMKVLQALQGDISDQLHYSAVFTIAKRDLETVRELMTRDLKGYLELISDSRDEEACCLTMDLFRLGQ